MIVKTVAAPDKMAKMANAYAVFRLVDARWRPRQMPLWDIEIGIIGRLE
tara:strand:- start:646 stop:792 length:147 start_codon:yes stop_codon:yes gene_type:complete